ncbi:T9SS type A sorting domain-containing protein, partial [Flavobacterium sp. SM15]|uniref:T9SS type A sorting domain-containing protein n=1 Tax=Flavobacterium sp. SM15 TaxID=2908005 RepID=UPI001EDA542E
TYSWSPSGGTAATASGLAAGTYTCTITDANSCQTTQSFTITEPSAFNITNSHINVSCNGAANGSATVSVTGGTGAYTYSWSPSGGTAPTASGLAAGTYTCTITDANSCQTTSTFTITQPAILDNSITLSSTMLTANQVGATYQWIDCTNGNAVLPGETNQNFTPTVSGDYAVIITMGSCSVTSFCTTVLGAVDFESNTNFVVYPNPSNGIITIKSSFDGQFQIMNQLGQIVRTVDVISGIEKTIELENVAKGIYHLSGNTKEGVKVNKKIILN